MLNNQQPQSPQWDPSDEDFELPIGVVLVSDTTPNTRYTLESILGQGYFGVVYKARVDPSPGGTGMETYRGLPIEVSTTRIGWRINGRLVWPFAAHRG